MSRHKFGAIPTMHQGIRMRSRLEAKYACLLDAWGLPWTYEDPGYDFQGYIPDFIVTLPTGAELLLECKPGDADDLAAHQKKINSSGYVGAALVVGSSLELDADGRPDLVARGCLETPGRWRKMGRAGWPAAWGSCPWQDPQALFESWRDASNAVQWRAPVVK